MHEKTREPSFDGTARPLLIGLLAVQIFLGYEWLMSGLAKILSGDFASGLGDGLAEQTQDLTGWYKSFLDGAVIPNGQLFGYLVEIGEFALGVTLIATAIVWITRWSALTFTGRQVLLALIVAAGVIGIFMNVNFHLANGSTHPWLIAADPNDEGVDLDSLMPIIQFIISAVAFVFWRRVRAARPGAIPERTIASSASGA